MTTQTPDHDLNHEVYLDPKDKKEHINHGMIEYSEEDLVHIFESGLATKNWTLS